MSTRDSQYAPALEKAFRSALAFLNSLDQRPVPAAANLAELRARLRKPLEANGLPPGQVIEELVYDTSDGITGSGGGRFFAWAIGGSVPAALAADWLTSTWDQNAALYACSPAAAVVEEVVGEWLKNLLGLPQNASFALVSGCQMAHTTCLAAARHALLARRGWDVERKGLCGAPQIRILASNRHGSIERTIRLLGIGSDHVLDLPLDESARMMPSALDEYLTEDGTSPAILVLQAGDLNVGAFDDYASAIRIAKKHAAWVHVDGAFGLWAAASPRYKHLLAGADAADSWATDGHKWLNLPYDCGYAFVADPDAHRRSMSYRASYLVHDKEARDQIDWNPEWSRRARGFCTYAALRELGRAGLADLVERCCLYAHDLLTALAELPGVEIVARSPINQGLVRFLDPSPAATEEDHDRRTDEVIKKIIAQGKAFFMGTTWRGRRAMRISVLNWQTSEVHVRDAVRCIAEVLDV